MIKAWMDNRRVANPPVGRTEAVGTLLPSRPLPGTPRGRLNRKTVDRTALQDGPNGARSNWAAGNRRTQDYSRERRENPDRVDVRRRGPAQLRHQLWDSEGRKVMVWDVPGPNGYGELMQERILSEL